MLQKYPQYDTAEARPKVIARYTAADGDYLGVLNERGETIEPLVKDYAETYATRVTGHAELRAGAEPLASCLDEQLWRSILEKELAQKFLTLGGFAFFDNASPPSMVRGAPDDPFRKPPFSRRPFHSRPLPPYMQVHCAVLTDYPSEEQAAIEATAQAPRRLSSDELYQHELGEREHSTNLGGEQHVEFSSPIQLHASEDMATVFYGKHLADPSRATQLHGVLRGLLASRVRFDPVRSAAVGRPVASAWLNPDELPTPTVAASDASSRTIDLGIRSGGLVLFHDFESRAYRSSEVRASSAPFAVEPLRRSQLTTPTEHMQAGQPRARPRGGRGHCHRARVHRHADRGHARRLPDAPH